MLIRAYRFTDKASLMILKSSVALSTLALDGINLIVGSPRPQGGGVLGLLFGFAALVLALLRQLGIIVGLLLARLMWIVRVIARRIWQLLSLVFGRLMLLFGNRGGRTIRGARASATGSQS
jgi:hypothetical protein